MEYSIESIPSSRVFRDGRLRHQLTSLTLRGGSGMRDSLNDKDKGRILLAKDSSGKVVGWGWAHNCGDVHVYVNRKYRKQGIGTMIASRARRIVQRRPRKVAPIAWPWDEAGRNLFKKVGIRDGN